ncbi:hypothetical protein [Anaeromyxobacter oryzae]|uniref:Lipocalin-like domain-containing protein n=1 Tax=Anaeromyxobacter oryzae TaxID=2918170 RepID=A0ABM7WSR9_9BACT|nr:hypothetical protein [Anaeromyxobacter oryzae]BDG02512.1 hypothetical protein AMOR_15080 [Anaeromyxobacter oryzae]
MKHIVLLASLCAGASLAGCSNTPDDESAGTWQVDFAPVDGPAYACSGTLEITGQANGLSGTLTCGYMDIPVKGFRDDNYLQFEETDSSGVRVLITGSYRFDRIELDLLAHNGSESFAYGPLTGTRR